MIQANGGQAQNEESTLACLGDCLSWVLLQRGNRNKVFPLSLMTINIIIDSLLQDNTESQMDGWLSHLKEASLMVH